MDRQLQGMASQQQEIMSSSERVVHEVRSRPVPTFVDLAPSPELYPLRLTSMPLEPNSVHWDSHMPRAMSPEQTLQRMDQDLQRLATEVKRLWGQSSVYQPLAWHRPLSSRDPVVNKFWDQSALEREAEFQQLWNQSAYGSSNVEASMPTSFEVPRGFARLNPTPQPLMPRLDAPWGSDAYIQAWRKKENFHIDNPVIKGSDGHSQFRLEFDLRQFNAGEIEVTTEGNLLTVQAKHEEMNEGRQVRREYFRQCTIPQDVEPKSIVSQLSPTGILSVSAPMKAGVEESVKSISMKTI